ncbi:MAG: phytanoyl-CoA dioxygenase family protein [Luminiphilus sp.]|jgi:ectoine hydroxylase-related dioxygenase (phytanoyl-CoA dioxygenase family)|nr:phytanoyl-CoA dioxygenase family protein [Luminiphilus sp.]MDG2134662.1 phytanoyl-CoA dioxygenase family protein [Luminiphilus sp.]
MPEVTHLPPDCCTDDIIEVLERDGAAIVDGFVSNIWLAEFNNAIQMPIDHYTPYDYGEPEAEEFLGRQTVRLNGLISKAPNYIDLIADERLLTLMDHFLGPECGQFRLNSSEIIEIHGGETSQVLHWDDMIWPAHFWAPNRLLQFNVMIAGTDFTATNGATQVVPGSHTWDHSAREATPAEIAQATMKAGSAVFIPGKTLHGGGTNTDGSRRRAIVASYVLGWLRTQENHFLHTTVEQAKEWPERVRQLLGYELYAHYDDNIQGGPLGYYEYGCPSALFDEG